MRNKNNAFKWFILSLLFAGHLTAINAQADAPDAGQLSQPLIKQPNLNPTAPVELLRMPAVGDNQYDANSDIRILVNKITVTGNQVQSSEYLEALLADLIGAQRNFAEISSGVNRITNWYRQNGYLVARAYLPEQDLKDGVVMIHVLEGLLGTQQVNNRSRVADARVKQHFEQIQAGTPLQSQTVDRAVLLLSDTPGVGGARAALRPGQSVGTSDLIFELEPGQAYVANVELDNYGSHYTGENRLGGALAINSPFNFGDQLTLRAMTSDQDMTYARLAYQLPLNGNGLKLGAAYSDMNYGLGREYADLNAHGSANSASVYLSYPFIRTQALSLYGTVTLEQKDTQDIQGDTVDKKVRLVNLGVTGSRQDAFGGGGLTNFGASVVVGDLGMDSVTLEQDAASANAQGGFSKININISRLQRINDNNVVYVAASGQLASKNLNSTEKLYLGGSDGVRAYPPGEAGGDEGLMVNAELRHTFSEKLQGLVFLDGGTVTINKNAYITDAANTRNIAGAGFGLNASYKAIQLKSVIAWRLHGGPALSEPISEDTNPRLWVQLSSNF
jgi:hemolysin activation/secretion protein